MSTINLHVDDYYDRAQLLFDAGLHRDATRVLRKALAQHPNDPRCRLLMARVAVARGAAHEAMGELNAHSVSAKGDQDTPDVMMLRAQALMQSGDYERARGLLEALAATFPHDVRPARGLALACLQSDDKTMAMHWLRRVIEIDPGQLASRRLLVQLVSQSNPHKAVALLRDHAHQAADRMTLARLLVRCDRLADAETAYRKLLEMYADDARVWLEAGGLADRRGATEVALARLSRAVSIGAADEHPRLADVDTTRAAKLATIDVLMHAGRLPEAAAHAWRLLKDRSAGIEAGARLLACALAAGRESLARRVERRLSRRASDAQLAETVAQAWAHVAGGSTIRRIIDGDARVEATLEPATRDGRTPLEQLLDESIQTLSAHAVSHPGRADTHYHLARCFHGRGQLDEAGEALAGAIEINPGYNAARIFALDVIGDRQAA